VTVVVAVHSWNSSEGRGFTKLSSPQGSQNQGYSVTIPDLTEAQAYDLAIKIREDITGISCIFDR
jgi:hypothetical protein